MFLLIQKTFFIPKGPLGGKSPMKLPDINPESITTLAEAKNVIENLLHLHIKQQEEIARLQDRDSQT